MGDITAFAESLVDLGRFGVRWRCYFQWRFFYIILRIAGACEKRRDSFRVSSRPYHVKHNGYHIN